MKDKKKSQKAELLFFIFKRHKAVLFPDNSFCWNYGARRHDSAADNQADS